MATIAKARAMRKALTPAEARLWVALRGLRSLGFHFRKQHPLLGYFPDFVCLRVKLIIEVDGCSHEVREAWDRRRGAALAAEGFNILRVQNTDVRDNLEGMVAWILEELRAREARWTKGVAPSPPGRSATPLP